MPPVTPATADRPTAVTIAAADATAEARPARRLVSPAPSGGTCARAADGPSAERTVINVGRYSRPCPPIVGRPGRHEIGLARSEHAEASLPAEPRLTIADLIEDCEAVRQALGVRRWMILGQSFGGMALRYAISYPGSVSAAVFENPVWDVALTARAALPRIARRLAALRLSRAGNRRLNHVPCIAGIVQLRNDTPGRACYRRKRAAGKTPTETMRCLRRRLSDAVCRQLVADARGHEHASPGGHPGASLSSSAAGLSPDTGTSDQPLPGPAQPTLPPPQPLQHPMAPAAATPRRRARGVNVERPTGRTTLTPTSAAAPSTTAGPCP